uniref:Uncharacterized protein n=1 Tax=Anopheles albimanus TaxID=7167 RepID=A0A182FNB7_ANOAL
MSVATVATPVMPSSSAALAENEAFEGASAAAVEIVVCCDTADDTVPHANSGDPSVVATMEEHVVPMGGRARYMRRMAASFISPRYHLQLQAICAKSSDYSQVKNKLM